MHLAGGAVDGERGGPHGGGVKAQRGVLGQVHAEAQGRLGGGVAEQQPRGGAGLLEDGVHLCRHCTPHT